MRQSTLTSPARQSRAGVSTGGAGPVPGVVPYVPPAVARAIDTASSLVGRRTVVLDGVDYGSDCAALVRAAFASAGHPLPPDARDAPAVYALAARRGALSASRRPRPGDLLFLSDRPAGPPAHVGIVVRSEPDGTVVLVQRVARGVLRVRVNLAYPEQPTDPSTGKHINDTLVVGTRAVPAGSLVVGVSDMLRHS